MNRDNPGITPLELKNKRTLVVGLAKTGVAVARFLKKSGAHVTVTDLKNRDELGSYVEDVLAMGISLSLGAHETGEFMNSDLIVLSPGVPHTIAPLEKARGAGIRVIGEIELASRHIEEPMVAVTGTNGKTTTTSLIGEMLKASGHSVFVGGNIGAPLIDYVETGTRVDTIVAEISSFQLDTIEHFKPEVGLLLNITEDHLDRYESFEQYVQSKGKLFENQESSDVAILNAQDPAVHQLEGNITSRRFYFNGPETSHGAVIKEKEIVCNIPEKASAVFSLAGFGLKGRHNVENAAAASLAALVAGGTKSGIQAALDTYKGLHHRTELVKSARGVHYYNDSKATNVDAVKRSLESFEGNVILIMGGRDKGGSYAVLEPLIRKRVKCLIAMGEARDKVLNALGRLTQTEETKTVDEAVALAHKYAMPGDIVLLSPGCSSFDQFTDYTERGEAFVKAVDTLTIEK